MQAVYDRSAARLDTYSKRQDDTLDVEPYGADRVSASCVGPSHAPMESLEALDTAFAIQINPQSTAASSECLER
jgi:hypothetical protein